MPLSARLLTALLISSLVGASSPAKATADTNGCAARIAATQIENRRELYETRVFLERIANATRKDGTLRVNNLPITSLGALVVFSSSFRVVTTGLLRNLRAAPLRNGSHMKQKLFVAGIGIVLVSAGIYTLVMEERTSHQLKAALIEKESLLLRQAHQLELDLFACQDE